MVSLLCNLIPLILIIWGISKAFGNPLPAKEVDEQLEMIPASLHPYLKGVLKFNARFLAPLEKVEGWVVLIIGILLLIQVIYSYANG